MGLSNYLRDLLLARVFLNPLTEGFWVALHDADPGDVGAAELRDYTRQPVSFQADGAGAISNRTVLQYDDMPAATVTHFSIWDAQTGGRFLFGGALDMGLLVPQGKPLRWREGDLILRIP